MDKGWTGTFFFSEAPEWLKASLVAQMISVRSSSVQTITVCGSFTYMYTGYSEASIGDKQV